MMKKQPNQGNLGLIRTGYPTRRTAWRAFLSTALASLALVGASSAQGGGGSGGGSPGFSGGGDETVGTLPIVGGIHLEIPVVRGWRGDHPAFYLEGTPTQLGVLIRGARGRGFATFEALDPQAAHVRIAFHGDVTLVLDRELLGMLPVQTGFSVPASFGARQATISWGTNPARTVRLRSGLLLLPVPSLSADRILDQGPLQLHALGRNGAQTFDTIYATGETVVLRQSN